MKKLFAALMMLALGISSALAADRGTPAEAEAMVKKAIAHYKKVGKDKALVDFVRKDGGFIDRDLYVTVYDYSGVTLAHINPRIVGKNMLERRDENGKFHIKERIELARKQGSGWQDLAGRVNPTNKKAEDKRTYFESYDNLVFASGVFKPN